MTNISNFLYDGANWQAQAVLAYLRANNDNVVENTWNDKYHQYDAYISVGRYECGREQGYVFAINYKSKQKNYAVYEHRNSDNLIVLISEGITINTPSIDFMWKDKGGINASKYDYDKGFSYGQIMECGNFIIDDMKNFIDNLNKEDK